MREEVVVPWDYNRNNKEVSVTRWSERLCVGDGVVCIHCVINTGWNAVTIDKGSLL